MGRSDDRCNSVATGEVRFATFGLVIVLNWLFSRIVVDVGNHLVLSVCDFCLDIAIRNQICQYSRDPRGRARSVTSVKLGSARMGYSGLSQMA